MDAKFRTNSPKRRWTVAKHERTAERTLTRVFLASCAHGVTQWAERTSKIRRHRPRSRQCSGLGPRSKPHRKNHCTSHAVARYKCSCKRTPILRRQCTVKHFLRSRVCDSGTIIRSQTLTDAFLALFEQLKARGGFADVDRAAQGRADALRRRRSDYRLRTVHARRN
jgi:hypothetical protein